MSNVHLFRAKFQPATRFSILGPKGNVWIRCNPRARRFTRCCRQWRWAKYVRVHAYYDGIYQWCKPGHGCKADAK